MVRGRRSAIGALLAAGAVVAGGCGSGGGGAGPATSTSASMGPVNTRASATTGPSITGVLPGKAVVTAGDQRWEFIVHDCLLGEETGSPNRRLALSASDTEPFLDAGLVLNVDILVSQRVPGVEEHVISITDAGPDRPDLGAADVPLPSRGGPAPDDWIQVDEQTRAVRGHGFELRATSPGGPQLEAGTLVADCT